MPAPRPRWRPFAFGGLVAAVAAITLVVALETLESRQQPQEIALLVADFESGSSLETRVTRTLPTQLGDLRLRDSRAGRVGGVEITAHSYEDPAGHEVVIYQADESFPVAEGAEHGAGGETWTAQIDGAVLLCPDYPVLHS